MKKVKKKFIILTLLSIFLLLSALVIAMNAVNYVYGIREADSLLEFLSRHRGTIPDEKEDTDEQIPPYLSHESTYETRYFSVLFDEDGRAASVDTGSIASVEPQSAVRIAEQALQANRKKGFVESYRFHQKEEGDMVRIIFLDLKQKMNACYRFLGFGIASAVVVFLIISLAILFFADRLIRPITESYEKQNRFIADAGHEIKTPLTIINANVDILEMEYGHNEGFDEVRIQSERLAALTEELVLLARMEESGNALHLIEFPISEIVEEAVAPFKAIAASYELCLRVDIKPMLSMHGDQKTIARLLSILMDNAMKYTPAGGTVSVSLKKQSRGIALTVFNDTKEPVDSQSLPHVFDRFYRLDSSRNSETGGYGIGLSVAKAIVISHGGKISAWSKGSHSFGITATFI